MSLGDYSATAYNISQVGKYGVELFFVISGYLACFSLNKCVSVIEFYKKRIIRNLPLYYLCILYFFITETFFFKDVPVDPQKLGWLRYIFCLNGVVPSEGYFWSNIGITWTIPVFIVFYLIAPLLMKFSNTTFRLVVLLALTIGIAYAVNRLIPGWLSALNYLPCFVFGIIVYHSKKEKRQFICIFGFLLLVLIFKWASIENVLLDIVKDIFVVSSLFAVMIMLTESYSLNNRQLLRVFDILDDHSYTMYLVHGIVFCGVIDKFAIGTIPRVLIAVFGTAALTWTVHKFYEKPVQNFLKKVMVK